MGGRRRQYDLLRERFFEAGAQSLASFGLIAAPNRYVCPQCLRAFLPEAVPARELTLEHSPPRRLGGKPITLTCAACNPRAGSKLESALAREHDLENFARGVSGSWRGKLVTADERGAPVTIVRTDTGVEVAGHPHLTHPEIHRTTFEYFERKVGASDWRITLRLPAYDPRRAAVGHLRAAYLAAFAKLGYTFILNPLGAKLRTQIENPEVSHIPNFFATIDGSVEESCRGLIIIEKPFPFLAAQTGRRLVILPWPPSGVDPYARLKEMELTAASMQGGFMEWPTGMELALDKLAIAARAAKQGGGSADAA